MELLRSGSRNRIEQCVFDLFRSLLSQSHSLTFNG